MILKTSLKIAKRQFFSQFPNQTRCSAISKAISLGTVCGELPTEGAARFSCRLWGVVIGWGKIQVAMVTHLLVGCWRKILKRRAKREERVESFKSIKANSTLLKSLIGKFRKKHYFDY